MGGLTGGLTLEHHPGVFAAGALLMGISDLKDWYEQSGPTSDYGKSIAHECGGSLTEVPREYTQRTLLPEAGILARMPLMVCHERTDSGVLPSHAEKLIT